MVGRELQKIRPSGEDHQVLAGGEKTMLGKETLALFMLRIDILKNL